MIKTSLIVLAFATCSLFSTGGIPLQKPDTQDKSATAAPKIEIISAVFGSGRASVDCAARIREIIDRRPTSTTTITSSGMRLKNRGGHFRDLLRIRYSIDGIEADIEFENAAKVNFLSSFKANSQSTTAPKRMAAKPGENDAKPDSDSTFYAIGNARDCCYDFKRQKLYVTTGRQLVIVDLKTGKIDESIDLGGTVVSCDISTDARFLAIACAEAQAFYWVTLKDLDFQQVRFSAEGRESGVYDLCFGSDNSVLFGMTFKGSGDVKLRQFKKTGNAVSVIGRVRMNSIISASAERKYAVIAEGNISSGSIKTFDFETGELSEDTNTGAFNYEIASASEGRYVAQPQRTGCLVYDDSGTKIGNFSGDPVIAAAFHPESDSLFLMRHKASSVEEYDLSSAALLRKYALPGQLNLKADVSNQVVGTLHSLGGSSVHAHVSNFRAVHYQTFRSGRLKMGPQGKKFFALTPAGVHAFDTKTPTQDETKAGKRKPKRVIGTIRANEN